MRHWIEEAKHGIETFDPFAMLAGEAEAGEDEPFPGVYFLFGERDDLLLYVGVSVNVPQRIYMHQWEGAIPFSRVAGLEVTEDDARREIEAFYYETFRPPFNTRLERCTRDWSGAMEKARAKHRAWDHYVSIGPDEVVVVIRSGDDEVRLPAKAGEHCLIARDLPKRSTN